ncbi:hypothetical protein GF312_17875 [Candidatus Poribacteria bacterium]|nr:hypothetical protein [Candidatus Poribacteria bacterium]
MMTRRLCIILLTIVLAGCGLNVTRNILPVADQDVVILPRVKGAASHKNEISLIVVPLEDVKEADAFGVMIVNESSHWLKFKKEDFVLIQGGDVRKPMSESQVNVRMGASYKPTMPKELTADLYEWRKSINIRDSRGFRVIDEDKTLSVMRGNKEVIYVFFKTTDDISPMQLIIPNIQKEETGERIRFSFTFEVEKK